MRIIQKRERHPPVGHTALRIGLGHLLEDFLGLAVPEGVLIAHRAIEAALRNVVAGGLEMNRAESLIRLRLRLHRLCKRDGRRKRRAEHE